MQKSQKEQILVILEEIENKQGEALGDFEDEELLNTIKFAIKIIEDAISRIKEEVKDNNWIPVSERLPEEGEVVLVCDKWGFPHCADYREGKWILCHPLESRLGNITHWQPLPLHSTNN